MSKTDIQIAREANMLQINEVLGNLNVPDKPEAFVPIGRYIAKLDLNYLEKLDNKKIGIGEINEE